MSEYDIPFLSFGGDWCENQLILGKFLVFYVKIFVGFENFGLICGMKYCGV